MQYRTTQPAFHESLGMKNLHKVASVMVTENEAVRLMKGTKGKLFSVLFVKRTKPGVQRRMVCRLGVKQGVTGQGQSFDPASHSLLTVAEFVTNPETTRGQRGKFVGSGSLGMQFRNIPFEGLKSIRIQGTTFEIIR
jgi:hypothetical protein